MDATEVMAMGSADLAAAIRQFLVEHAKPTPGYEPGTGNPDDRYNGPDPFELERAADMLERGERPTRVWSEWGSGCYRPFGDRHARTLHDALVKAAMLVVPERRSSPGI